MEGGPENSKRIVRTDVVVAHVHAIFDIGADPGRLVHGSARHILRLLAVPADVAAEVNRLHCAVDIVPRVRLRVPLRPDR